MGHWMEDDWPDAGLRTCARCWKPVPADWDYAWCQECGENGTCKHGNPPHDCSHCDVESDRAYDEWREAT